jgi:chromosome segregation ATPase
MSSFAISNLDIALTAAKEELESLRSQLQELQDTMADRSTATEAGEREMALLQAQSREEDLRATIRELQEEIESNHSIAKMAMESAGTADTKLKQELADLQFEHALSLETVESLQTTIADLECRMQKLTAESVEAGIIAQRLMDVEKMLSDASETEQTRVNEIEHHLLVIRELRQVVDEQNRMLEFAEVEYEILLESTQAEHRATTTTIKDLQERLENLTVLAESDQDDIKRAAELARHNIQQELDTVHANLSAMELSLKENTDSLQASEDRAAKLRSILQEREKEVQRLKASMAETGQPIDGVVLQLRQEVNDLEARIERRNRQIALEQEKARKLGMNLQLAQDTVEEQDAILQDTRQQVWVMEKAKVALQTQVESLESAGIALAVIVQQTAAEAAHSESDMKRNIAELQNQLLEVGYCQNQLVLQLLIHRHCRASTSREAEAQVQRLSSELSLAVSTAQQLQTAHQDAMSSLEEKSMEQENVVATLQSQKVELDGELQALRIALSTITDAKQELEESAEASAREIAALTELHHQESASVQIEMKTLRETTHDLERRLSEVETEKASLLCQIQMFETDITELRQQLEVATNELQQKHSAMKAMQEDGSEQNNTLAVELEEAKAELTRLRQQIQGLTTDLEAAEERYSVILKKSQENEAVLVMAKEAAEEEMTRRAHERDVLRQEKDTLLNESAALSEAMDRLQQSTESSQQRMQQTIEREQQRREETEAQLSALTADVLNLQKSLDKAETLNRQLVRDVELAQAAMTSTERQKEEVRHEILVAEQHRVQLEARLSDLSHTITVLQQSKIALLQENESFRTELAANVGEIASLRVALGEQRREIDSLHNAKFDHSSQEKTALEETHEELGRERVLHEKRFVGLRILVFFPLLTLVLQNE